MTTLWEENVILIIIIKHDITAAIKMDKVNRMFLAIITKVHLNLKIENVRTIV